MTKSELIAEPGQPQLVMTREFQCRPEHLLRAFTEPELLMQWMGPRRMEMHIDQYDLRHGGAWRFTHRDENGEYGFRGVFHGTPSLDGIVQTWEFEGMPGHVQLQTATFEPRGEKTLLRMNSVYQSVEDRDGELQSGMEEGATESLERLEELVARLESQVT